MSLHDQITILRKGLGRHQASFERARAVHVELTLFATPEAVLTALHHSSSSSSEERFALVGALARVHGESGSSSLWTSILTVALEPFLLRLRARLRRPEDQDLDQRVLLAFFHALARPGVQQAGVNALLAIERATRSALARQRESKSKEDLVPFDDDTYWNGGFSSVALAEARVEAMWAARRATLAVAHLAPVRAKRLNRAA